MKIYDVAIVGGGPVGLYAGFYAGMHGLSVAIIEAFDEVGGQPQYIYPEKQIYDIAGLPQVSGGDLTQNLLTQLERVEYDLCLGERVEWLHQEPTEDFYTIDTDQSHYLARSVLLTSGAGLISPRKIGVAGEDQAYYTEKLAYFIKNLEDYRDQKVAVLGGGDSALDWALMLENVASEVHLVHRRLAFRAHELTVEQVKQSSIELHLPFTVSNLTENGLMLQKVKSDELTELAVDKIVVNYGFLTSQLDLMEELACNRNGHVLVDSQMRTNQPGIYAAGDICDYAGKVPLIAVGFGEAVTAINDITKSVKFDHDLRRGHSSSLFK